MNSSVVTFPARANHLEFQSSLFRHICNGKQLTKLLHAERGIQFAFHDRPHSDQHRSAREFHSGLGRANSRFPLNRAVATRKRRIEALLRSAWSSVITSKELVEAAGVG